MFSLPSASPRASPLEQGDGMKHSKSSRSAKKREERREGKQHAPRVTPFPLPPANWGISQSLALQIVKSQIAYRIKRRVLVHLQEHTEHECMMERERWA